MRTITKTVYTFKELIEQNKLKKISSDAVEKARQWLVEGNTSYDWWEYEYQKWNDALNQIGFEEPKIRFSGFCSQGDGASFLCKNVDIDKLIFFLTTDIEAKDCIETTERTKGLKTPDNPDAEDFLPYVLFRLSSGGSVGINREFKRLLRVKRLITLSIEEHRNCRYAHESSCYLESSYDAREKASLRPLYHDFTKTVEELRYRLCRAIYRDLEEEYNYKTSEEQLLDFAEGNDYTFDKFGKREG